jgi:hypothetical protein
MGHAEDKTAEAAAVAASAAVESMSVVGER